MPKGATLRATFHFLAITVDSVTVGAWPAFKRLHILNSMSAADNTGRRGIFFYFFFISPVGCQSQLVDPPPQKRLYACERWPPLGAAGPGLRSMGLNGSQRGMDGCAGSSAPASSREKEPRGRLPILYRQAELYLALSILTPLLSFSNCANKKEKEEKSISISEWLGMPRVPLTLWPRQPVR